MFIPVPAPVHHNYWRAILIIVASAIVPVIACGLAYVIGLLVAAFFTQFFWVTIAGLGWLISHWLLLLTIAVSGFPVLIAVFLLAASGQLPVISDPLMHIIHGGFVRHHANGTLDIKASIGQLILDTFERVFHQIPAGTRVHFALNFVRSHAPDFSNADLNLNIASYNMMIQNKATMLPLGTWTDAMERQMEETKARISRTSRTVGRTYDSINQHNSMTVTLQGAPLTSSGAWAALFAAHGRHTLIGNTMHYLNTIYQLGWTKCWSFMMAPLRPMNFMLPAQHWDNVVHTFVINQDLIDYMSNTLVSILESRFKVFSLKASRRVCGDIRVFFFLRSVYDQLFAVVSHDDVLTRNLNATEMTLYMNIVVNQWASVQGYNLPYLPYGTPELTEDTWADFFENWKGRTRVFNSFHLQSSAQNSQVGSF